MTDDDDAKEMLRRHEQIEDAIEMLPKKMEQGEVIALLCTIAGAYAEEEVGLAAIAPQGAIESLAMALDHMLNMRGMIDETETDTMH